MRKNNYIFDCLLFQSKDRLHIFLGVWVWLQFIIGMIKIFACYE
jgi:hypothetical protein